MKPTILVYCGEDGEAGKALATTLRDGTKQVVMCSAAAFAGVQYLAYKIVFTSDVSQRLRDRISAAHGFPADVPGMPIIMKAIEPKKRGRPRKIA